MKTDLSRFSVHVDNETDGNEIRDVHQQYGYRTFPLSAVGRLLITMLLKCSLQSQPLKIRAPEKIHRGDHGDDYPSATVNQVPNEAETNDHCHNGDPLFCSTDLQGQGTSTVYRHERAVHYDVDKDRLPAEHGEGNYHPEEAGDSKHPGDDLRGTTQDTDQLPGDGEQVSVTRIQFRGEHDSGIEARTVASSEKVHQGQALGEVVSEVGSFEQVEPIDNVVERTGYHKAHQQDQSPKHVDNPVHVSRDVGCVVHLRLC